MNIDSLIRNLGKHAHVINELLDLENSDVISYDDALMDSALSEMSQLLGRSIGDTREQSRRAGWDCLNSSEGHCVYNDLRDPSHDQCAVCGQPEERK